VPRHRVSVVVISVTVFLADGGPLLVFNIYAVTDCLYSDSTELSLTLSLNEFQIGSRRSSDYVIGFPSLVIVGLTDFLYPDSTELSLTLSLNEFQIGPRRSSDYRFRYCRFASIQITKELFLILYLTSFRVTSRRSDCRLSLSVGLALFSSYRGFSKSGFVIRRQDPPLFMLSAPNPLA
jgi:hypothetical protein